MIHALHTLAKKHVLKLIVLLLCAVASMTVTHVTYATDLNENVKNSTVFIALFDSKGTYFGRGSGFYVDEGIVVTNKHIIDGRAKYYRVYLTNDEERIDWTCYQEINRSDIKINLEDDVAYIRAYNKCPHGSVYFAEEDPKIGEPVEIWGYPGKGSGNTVSYDLTYTTGHVIGSRTGGVNSHQKAGKWIWTDAPINKGNSGGPVVQNGKVVGVATAAHFDANGNAVDGFFVPMSMILDGLNHANNSTFGYTPQSRQKNKLYEEKKSRVSDDPFNPIPSAGEHVSRRDCQQSLGAGGESTGYVKQQGDACRCKSSYHREGDLCLPGSEEYIAQVKKAQETKRNKKMRKLENEKTQENEFTDVEAGRWSVSTISFTDIAEAHPYRQAIVWGKENSILGGYPDPSDPSGQVVIFQPDRTVNRAEFLKIAIESEKLEVRSENGSQLTNCFLDVEEEWFAPYICAAKERGIVEGYTDGTFRPEQEVNLAEALKMTYQVLGIETQQKDGTWFQRFHDHALSHEILFDRSLQPNAPVSRKDVVWIVWKLKQGKMYQ